MADAEEKAKAEKLAAGRKRLDAYKKQKAKKAAPAKKSTAEEPTAAAPAADDDPAEPSEEPTKPDDVEDEPETAAPTAEPDAEDDEAVTGAIGDSTENTGTAAQPSLSLQSQMRSESFKRTAGALGILSPGASNLKSPSLPPLSADGDSVQDIYRKQAQRIEALETDNKRLEKEASDLEVSRDKIEQELEDLREAQADVVAGATATTKSPGEVAKLKAEITALQRQLAQQSKEKRRPSGNVPTSPQADALASQLSAKNSTVESLELEMSKLRLSLSEAESSNAELKSRVSELEASLQSAEKASDTAANDLASLRASLSPSAASSEEAKDQATRIALLTSDLHAAQRQATDSQTRATNLEKKIETLSSLHRESEARQQSQITSRSKEMERLRTENTDMRKKISSVSNENARLRERRARGDSISSSARPGTSSSAGGADVEGRTSLDADDTTGAKRLQARIRALEAENSDLRRGIWRDKRRELQVRTGMLDEGDTGEDEDDGSAGGDADDTLLAPGASPNGASFDDVDLSPPSAYRRKSSPYNTFGFTNILNTFTGRDAASYNAATSPGGGYFGSAGSGGAGQQRRPSLRKQGSLHGARASSGELNEVVDEEGGEGGADESAVEVDGEAASRAAAAAAAQQQQQQQDEAMRRLERVKQVKRGLNDWKGWRVDMVDLRGGNIAGVFDV